MKYILIFLLLKFSLFAQSLYLLPDDYDCVIYQIEKKIKKAKSNILIITEIFNNYKLKKALIKAAKKGVKITLISADEDMKSILAIYKNIESKELKAIDNAEKKGIISMSIIIIDNTLTCKLSTNLDSVSMQHDISIFTCKSDKNETLSVEKLIKPLKQRSESYLKY